MPKLNRRNILFLLPVFLFLNFNLALASEEVIYKDTRPRKTIFEAQKGTDKGEEGKDKGFIYDPTGKTDPFKSFIAKREELKKKEKRKPRTYLETVELSQLNLTVIVISPKGKWAMVRDSKGLGHVIKEGTAIGTNGGVVHKIKEGEVIIREEYMDFRGRKKDNYIAKKTPSLRQD